MSYKKTMKDYVKYIKVADAVKVLFDDCIRYVFPTTAEPTTEFIKLNNAINLLQIYPSADVEPVVRCKDCKHWDKHSQYGYDNENGVYGNYCKLWTPEDDFYAVETPADGFCYNGERKNDD